MSKQNLKPYGETSNPTINIISETTKIKGDIIANDDIRIDGELTGNISAKGRLVVGPKGKIEGKIDCGNIEVSGYVKGKITASELLNLKESSKIEGDIIAGKLAVEPGSMFTGTCAMRGANPANETPKTK